MLNILPCPYCGGEVEVVRLANKGKQKQYRIQCMKCHALTAKGTKFEKETEDQGLLRISQYEQVLEKLLYKPMQK